LVAPGSSTLLDLLSTSLVGLKQSADAFPPLKSAVGGVLALWDIAEASVHPSISPIQRLSREK
jgi:hypothetical protein